MALTRRLVELGPVGAGRRPRSRPGSRWRGRWSARPGFASLPDELRAQVAEELNVHALEPLSSVGGDLVDYTVKPNFRALGSRFGKSTPGGGRGDRQRGRARHWPPCCARTVRPR